MKKIAIYGKGGIGKSTVTANLSAAFARKGLKVLQIGCDPKADSTINLLHGRELTPVLEFMKEHDEMPEIGDIIYEGFGGVSCMETGGPTPGIGCAGRGIIATFQLMEELDVFGAVKPDVVLYDVLGEASVPLIRYDGYAGRECLEDFPRLIRAAIVDDNDLRTILEDIVYDLPDGSGVVKRRNNHT